jgi:hypothetical protein
MRRAISQSEAIVKSLSIGRMDKLEIGIVTAAIRTPRKIGGTNQKLYDKTRVDK